MPCSIQTLISQASAFNGLDPGQLQIAGLQLLCLKKGGACNPIDLLASASQFSGLNPLELEMVITKLLCILASESCDVQALLDDSASVFGLSPNQVQVITTELLCQWYGGDCTVSDLLEEGSCFLCLMGGQMRVVFAQLLCEIAGDDCGTVQTLLSEAACLGCLTITQLLVVQTTLLCTLVNGGNGGNGGYQPPAAFGDIPNDSFEDYSTGQNLSGLNGGENGVTPFIINWESVWVSQPWFVDVATGLNPNQVAGLTQWVKADAIVGVDPEEALDTWEDQSGNNNDFTAAGAQRPTYQTNIQNGLPGVLFADVAGVGMTGSVAIAAGNYSILLVAKNNDIANLVNRRFLQGSNNYFIGVSGGIWRFFDGTFYILYQETTAVKLIIITRATTPLVRGYVDGGEGLQHAAAHTYPGTINLGATGGFNEPAEGHIFEVAVWGRAILPGEATGLAVNMITKWGI